MSLLLFSHPVMFNSLWPMDCSTPGLPVPHHLPEFAQDCVHGIGDVHPAISSSDALFSFHTWSFLASGTFPMSHLSASDDLNSGASASTSVLPVNIQGWSPLWLAGLISLLSEELSGVFSSTTVEGINYLASWILYGPTLTMVWDHYEDHSLDYSDLCCQSNVSAFQHIALFSLKQKC